jgi:hypothetical protein
MMGVKTRSINKYVRYNKQSDRYLFCNFTNTKHMARKPDWPFLDRILMRQMRQISAPRRTRTRENGGGGKDSQLKTRPSHYSVVMRTFSSVGPGKGRQMYKQTNK